MRNYWLLSAGKDGELWPTFWNEKVVAIGWSALGDLRRFESRDKLAKAYRISYPTDRPGQARNGVLQAWSFCNTVQDGELVFVRSHGALIGIGEVQGTYDFLSTSHPLRKKLNSEFFDDDFPHIRRVHWVSLWGGLKRPLAFTKLTVMP